MRVCVYMALHTLIFYMNKKEIFPINVIAYKDLQKYTAEFNCNKIINKNTEA